jgi:hypothetical protein
MDRRLATSILMLAVAASAHGAEPRLDAARMRTLLTPARPLGDASGRAVFDVHFAGTCIAVEDLPFEHTCSHVPLEDRDDPSPWPDAFIALEDDRIVATIVADARWVPRSWRCVRLPHFRGPKLCTPPDVDRAVRSGWADRWSTVLRSAG